MLGAAGLLDGYRATSHWIVRDQLALFNVIPTDERMVVDRNRITGAGVTTVKMLRGAHVQFSELVEQTAHDLRKG